MRILDILKKMCPEQEFEPVGPLNASDLKEWIEIESKVKILEHQTYQLSARVKRLIHLAPLPVDAIGDATEQLAAQGWKREEVLFAGMAALPATLALPGVGQQSLPVYIMLFSKQFVNGSTPELPVLKSSGEVPPEPYTLVKG